MTQTIFSLSQELANQIAAGEVVERPLSVVKELLENSLDAGATNISIELQDAGISEIVIRDNGKGISQEDIPFLFEKYATSKIKKLEDLYSIMSFGFRGEALASIASISDVECITKTSTDTFATRVYFENSLLQKEAASHNIGTTFRIKHLFAKTPARLNYLKTPRTEYAKIHDFVQKMALSRPDVEWRLTHNMSESFFYPKVQNVGERLFSVYGDEIFSRFREVSSAHNGLHISGYITDPKISFSTKDKQSLYVNGRLMQSLIISKAISQAYERFIPKGNHPAYVLFLEIDPTTIDVNVHPRKMELRFAQENMVFRAFYHAVEDVLKQENIGISHKNSPNDIMESQKKYFVSSGMRFKNYSPYTFKESNPLQGNLDISFERYSGIQENKIPEYRILGQLHRCYIVVETIQGITIYDQHALAERVNYEKLCKGKTHFSIQTFLAPVLCELTHMEFSLYQEYQSLFQDMGFDCSSTSGNALFIYAIPDFVKKENLSVLISDMLQDISELGSKSLEEVRNKVYAYAACRSAVKFGDTLHEFEMKALLEAGLSDYSATCPHGRPVVWSLSLEDLKNKYER